MAATATLPHHSPPVQSQARDSLARLADLVRRMERPGSMVFRLPSGMGDDPWAALAVQEGAAAVLGELDRRHIAYLAKLDWGPEIGPHLHLVMPSKPLYGLLSRLWLDKTSSTLVTQQAVL